jgi:hypothetical protein
MQAAVAAEAFCTNSNGFGLSAMMLGMIPSNNENALLPKKNITLPS